MDNEAIRALEALVDFGGESDTATWLLRHGWVVIVDGGWWNERISTTRVRGMSLDAAATFQIKVEAGVWSW